MRLGHLQMVRSTWKLTTLAAITVFTRFTVVTMTRANPPDGSGCMLAGLHLAFVIKLAFGMAQFRWECTTTRLEALSEGSM